MTSPAPVRPDLGRPDPSGSDGGPDDPSTANGQPRRRWRWVLLSVVCVLALVAGVALLAQRTGKVGPVTLPTTGMTPPGLERARSVLGDPPSGGSWYSGIWAGGATASTQRVDDFGAWRGAPTDAATMYPATQTWQTIHDSNWHIDTYAGFGGILAYGLPMLPDDDEGDFASVVKGDYDWVYTQIATDLVQNNRGSRTIVRIGWEANGDWFPWNTKVSTAEEYVAAYRHIVSVLRKTAPDLIIDFDLACGTQLRGQTDRLDALTKLYPGDDAVDLVGCDFYDWHNTRSTDEASWQQSVKPANAIGIQDVADFARAHGKGLTYPEWGLASTAEQGVGDNPFFIEKMRAFFEGNSDILVLESYFSEPDTSLANSIWEPAQMPKSAQTYARLW